MSDIFGLLAAIASSMLVVFGLPKQIVKNYQRKSTEGLDNWLVYSAVVTYFLWTLYAWTKPDHFLQACQTPGLALSLVLLWQIFHYKKTS